MANTYAEAEDYTGAVMDFSRALNATHLLEVGKSSR
jgi:hypothetical protein